MATSMTFDEPFSFDGTTTGIILNENDNFVFWKKKQKKNRKACSKIMKILIFHQNSISRFWVLCDRSECIFSCIEHDIVTKTN